MGGTVVLEAEFVADGVAAFKAAGLATLPGCVAGFAGVPGTPAIVVPVVAIALVANRTFKAPMR